MSINEQLLALTAAMPMKQINVNDAPYLQRFFAGTFRDGKDLWLHRFLSSDSERHIHSHPFNCISIMLNGRYTEDRICRETGEMAYRVTTPELMYDTISALHECVAWMGSGCAKTKSSFNLLSHCPQQSRIDVFDWHRITHASPETWTALIVDPHRLPFWFFKDESGDMKSMGSSPRDWHLSYKCRPESGVCGGSDDNRIK